MIDRGRVLARLREQLGEQSVRVIVIRVLTDRLLGVRAGRRRVLLRLRGDRLVIGGPPVAVDEVHACDLVDAARRHRERSDARSRRCIVFRRG
jgi:hypothetical protein